MEPNSTVVIQIWLFSVVLPIIIVIIGSYVTASKLQATTVVKMENMQKEIDQMRRDKADNNLLNVFKAQLDRIELKLDSHIQEPIQK